MTYIYVCKAPYMHIYPVYTYIWQYILVQHIYIYMQHGTLNNHAQATNAAGSSSQHSIMMQ